MRIGAMVRRVKEWVARTDDAAVPPRVRVRVAERYANRCAQCFQQLTVKGMEIDHEIALINGGEHRESNLVALCKVCHKYKTRLDQLAKKRIAASRKRSLGIEKRGRPVPG